MENFSNIIYVRCVFIAGSSHRVLWTCVVSEYAFMYSRNSLCFAQAHAIKYRRRILKMTAIESRRLWTHTHRLAYMRPTGSPATIFGTFKKYISLNALNDFIRVTRAFPVPARTHTLRLVPPDGGQMEWSTVHRNTEVILCELLNERTKTENSHPLAPPRARCTSCSLTKTRREKVFALDQKCEFRFDICIHFVSFHNPHTCVVSSVHSLQYNAVPAAVAATVR